MRSRLRRWLRRTRPAPLVPEPEAPAAMILASRGLGEPSSPGSADDAELDALRGELVRELDRLAAGRGGSPSGAAAAPAGEAQ